MTRSRQTRDKNKKNRSAVPDPDVLAIQAEITLGGRRRRDELLSRAALEKNAGAFKMLINLGADPQLAVRGVMLEGDPAHLAFLKQQGIDLRADHDLALRQAVVHNRPDLAQALVKKHGADINVRQGEPMVLAAATKNPVMIRALAGLGANVNVRNGLPLGLSVYLGCTEAVDALLDCGARPGLRKGIAFDAAASFGHRDIARLMLDRKAARLVSKADTAYRWARQRGRREVVALFDRWLEKGRGTKRGMR